MYAFSTTTYQGFQCLVTEEMSEKFRGKLPIIHTEASYLLPMLSLCTNFLLESGLPGVVFILPDSYIDPVNKEYGGRKLILLLLISSTLSLEVEKNRRVICFWLWLLGFF